MDIQRACFDRLKMAVVPGKVVVIYGPRRVGKTTLMKKILEGVESMSKLPSAIFAVDIVSKS